MKCTCNDHHKKPCRYCGEMICLGCYLNIHSDELCMYSEDDMGVEGNIITEDVVEAFKFSRYEVVKIVLIGTLFTGILIGFIAIFGGWVR